MKSTKKLAILTALSLSLSVNANAQFAIGLNDFFSQDYHYSWSFYGGGARAAGLGNAYTALSNDVFATSWNPAGMIDREEIYFGFDWNTFSPKGSYDFDIGGTSPGNIDHNGGDNNFFRNVGLTTPLTIRDQKFVIGLSHTRHFDTYSLFADKIFPSTPDNPDVIIERDGGVKSANFGVATRISESFSIGVAANVYFGDVVVDKQLIETYNNTGTGFQGTADFVLQTRELDSFKLSGFNVTIGGILELGDNTRLALTARTPFKMSFSNDVFSTRFATTGGGPPANALEDPFNDFTIPLVSDELIFSDVESKVEIPYSLALGWAQTWSENFLTSIDVEYQNFSGSKFLILDSTFFTPTGRKVNSFHEEFSNWKNTLQFRAGAEYTIRSRFGNIPLRTGFGILPQPYRDVSEYSVLYSGLSASDSGGLVIPQEIVGFEGLVGTGTAYYAHRDIDIVFDNAGDQVIAYSFSLGTGLHSPQRALDIAYVYNTSTRSYTTTSAVELPSNYEEFDPYSVLETNSLRVSEVKSSDHKFIISFTGYF